MRNLIIRRRNGLVPHGTASSMEPSIHSQDSHMLDTPRDATDAKPSDELTVSVIAYFVSQSWDKNNLCKEHQSKWR